MRPLMNPTFLKALAGGKILVGHKGIEFLAGAAAEEFVELANPGTADIDGVQKVSLSTWVYLDAESADNWGGIWVNRKDNDAQFLLYYNKVPNPNALCICHECNTDTLYGQILYMPIGSDDVNEHVWFHVVYVFDGAQPAPATAMKVYINGKQVAPTYLDLHVPNGRPTNWPSGNTVMDFGRKNFAQKESVNGSFCQFRLFNTAINQATIDDLYNSGDGNQGHYTHGNLIAEYLFEEQSGTSVADTSGSAVDHSSTDFGNNNIWISGESFE